MTHTSQPIIPKWFIDLQHEGCPMDRISNDWATYQSYRDEGHSKDFILVRVLGLQDPKE